jgi:phage terminase large subunit-like protein
LSSSVRSARPRWLTKTTPAERRRGDGDDVARFVEAYCRITKKTIAGNVGDLLVLRKWQRDDILGGLFARRADGRRRHRTGLIGLPRKNTKSTIGSGIALFGLMAEDDGAEVYSCAGSRDQARIVFGVAKRMVELDPELSSECKPYRDAIEVPSTGSVYRVLSSEAPLQEGLNPTLVVFDELHVQPDWELWNTMQLAFGARVDPLLVGITTAGVRSDSTGGDSVCYSLYQHGRRVVLGEIEDPSFFFAWWEAAEGADHRDPKTWRQSNPGYGDLIDAEDFESTVRRTPESEFRIKRCNQWVADMTSWLPTGAFEKRADRSVEVSAGETIVIGFDGSYSGDSTGLVGCTLNGHLFVVDAWEKPDGATHEWRVDIADVEQAIRDACGRWRVVEIACDPYRWQRSMQALLEEGWPIVEWPTSSPARMVPACAKFYDGVMGGTLTTDGDQRLERHVRNAVVKRDRFGPRIVKDARESPRKIDLAVCAVIAHDRAVTYRESAKTRPMYSY